MDGGDLRVGAVARRTGLTVRTLHHWDQVGLLRPARRTSSGHRLYGSLEIERLQRILSLRALGLRLDEIGSILREKAPSLEVVLGTHRKRVREQLDLLQALAARLDRALEMLAQGDVVGKEDLLETMEAMTMFEKHFSREQLGILKKREEALGPEAIRAAEEEWPRLIAAVRREMEAGTDPGSTAVQALAKRWRGLVRAFSGGDSRIEASLAGMYKAEPGMAGRQGLDVALFQYIGEACRATAEPD